MSNFTGPVDWSGTTSGLNFTSDTQPSIVFATDADVSGDVWLSNDLMMDWLPKACKWKKQWPIWHLKVSYKSA